LPPKRREHVYVKIREMKLILKSPIEAPLFGKPLQPWLKEGFGEVSTDATYTGLHAISLQTGDTYGVLQNPICKLFSLSMPLSSDFA
jgi:hypothetical protein